MSTKIYSGFRFSCGSMPEFYTWFFGVKQKLQDQQTEFWFDGLSNEATKLADRKIAGVTFPELSDRSPMSYLWDKHHFEPNKSDRMSIWDRTKGWMNIWPGPDGVIGYINGQNMPSYHEIVLQQPGVEDFGYWDNTDEPDDMDPDEWNRRCEIWQWVLSQGNGLVFQIHPPLSSWPETKEIAARQPDFETRVKHIASVKRDMHAPPDSNGKYSISGMLDWVESDLAKKLLRQYKDEVRLLLPKTLTESDYA